jgi:uncharacterized protein YndB with AHSA1/START domain
MASIKKEYFIAVPPLMVWESLTDPKQIDGWGAGPDVIMEMDEGGEFSLWGGDIHGKNLEIEPGLRLVQEWYTGSSKVPTEVTITVEADEQDEEEGTKLTIIQADVADEDVEELDRGWDEFYAGPLKEYCEQVG